MEPFTVAVPEADLADLRDRLARTRWPDPETVDDWSQGIPLAQVRELAVHWADGYDWRRVEQRLNALDHVRAEIDGVRIHAVHVRSPHADALPLVVTHGWPGSIIEFLDVAGPLADPTAHGGAPEDAFHVVLPSLPGYGFSGKPDAPGWDPARIARAWDELMRRLGYERYAAQGGDWGAMVTTELSWAAPDRLAGIHLNMPIVGRRAIEAAGAPTPEEQAMLARIARHQQDGTGYSKQQATRPQTLGYGLVDSPVAQLAWIVEKFHAWTDGFLDVLTADQLLDNVTLHWLAATGASSGRLYWERAQRRDPDGDDRPITVPAAISMFPGEIFPVSRRWAEQRFTDLRHFRQLDRGGHFAAFEQPALFVAELRDAFRPLRP